MAYVAHPQVFQYGCYVIIGSAALPATDTRLKRHNSSWMVDLKLFPAKNANQ